MIQYFYYMIFVFFVIILISSSPHRERYIASHNEIRGKFLSFCCSDLFIEPYNFGILELQRLNKI